MRKGIKILGKVFSVAVLLLIILPMVLSLLLDIPAVQNYVVQKAVRMVSRKLETTVSIDRVDIGLFSKVKVKGFYVEDYQRDTLLYVGSLDAYITGLGIFGGGVVFSRGEISGAKLYLRETPEGEMNRSSTASATPTSPGRAISACRCARLPSKAWISVWSGSRGAIPNSASTSAICTSTASRRTSATSPSTGSRSTPPSRPCRHVSAAASCSTISRGVST